MLRDFGFPTLQERRRQHRLTFLYKILEGHLPAIQVEKYLTPVKGKRLIKPTHKKDHATTNIVNTLARNNSRCFTTEYGTTEVFRNSFFPKTIREWNGLNETVATARSVEDFKYHLSSTQPHLK